MSCWEQPALQFHTHIQWDSDTARSIRGGNDANSERLFWWTELFSVHLWCYKFRLASYLSYHIPPSTSSPLSFNLWHIGKTYTVTGTPTEPGILPRSLDLIFNSISPQQLSSLQLKPKNFSGAVYLTEDEMTKELARKDNLLTKVRAEGKGVGGHEQVTVLMIFMTSTRLVKFLLVSYKEWRRQQLRSLRTLLVTY